MGKDLIKFNNNIEFIGSKDIVKYIDDKGNWCSISYRREDIFF